jgi:hypothetical protein
MGRWSGTMYTMPPKELARPPGGLASAVGILPLMRAQSFPLPRL